MNPNPDDPRLTAHVLGELGAEETALIESALAADPGLQLAGQEIARISQRLSCGLTLQDHKLPPSGREALLEQARLADQQWKILPLSRAGDGFQNWLIPAAAAAVVLVTTTIFIRMSGREAPLPSHQPASPAVATLPQDPTRKAATGSRPPAEIRPTVGRTSATVAEFSSMMLPVDPGSPGLGSISKFILAGKMPPREAVRTEDILNSFSYRLNGVTSIARGTTPWHPDTRGDGISRPLATLSCEFIACPWKPSATLLFISIRGNAVNASEIRLTFHANPQNVSRYRLLGYDSTRGSTPAKLPSTLAPNTTTTLALEIDPSKSEGNLGSLEWFANGEKAPAMELVYRRDSEPSDDARFAALTSTYGQWLTGEHAGLIDPEILGALVREVRTATLPADRAEFLKLIEMSLKP